VWLTTLLGCVAMVVWQRHDMRDVHATTARLREQVAPLRARQAETRRLRDDLAEIARRHSLVESLQHRRPPVRLVGAVSRSAAPLAGSLLVDEIRLERQETQPPAAGKPKENAAVVVQHEVTVTGTAGDEVAVTEFVQSLRDSGLFLAVQLRSTTPLSSDAQRQRQYEVTCAY
jgi:Tfp pilus assembly protein PilN